MSLTVGSLCTGTAQYERALSLAGVDTEVTFVADPDPGAATLLAHHYPDVPNLGDIKAVDWTRVRTPDILTAGYPCQGFSLAGQRLGEHDERFIWPHVFSAVRDLRPRVVLLENVPGHLSLGFGRVLGDLASIGYVGRWVCVRASDVGAAHKRERVFIIAHEKGDDPAAALGLSAAGPALGRRGDGAVLSLLPTPRTSDTNGAGSHGNGGLDLRTAVTLLPTPRAQNGEDRNQRIWLRPAGQPQNLENALALLPTPRASDGEKGGPNQRGSKGDLMLSSAVQPERWGQFAPAIARQTEVMGRPAPEPTEPGRDGKRRLSPRFAEWLMGHLDGFVTDVPGLTRSRQLKAIGNGIVALQGALGVHLLAGVA